MDEGELVGSTPQFGTAEYTGSAGGDTCRGCQQPINGLYYKANAATLCGNCAGKLQGQIPQDSHGAFIRAVTFGVGGFAAGLVLFSGFTILTGIQIGFVSLAVGWLVGKAMMMGSGGVGGRRYQIAAVLLTYAAVSLASIPITIHYIREHRQQPVSQKRQPPSSPALNSTTADSTTEESQPEVDSAPARQPQSSAPASQARPSVALGAMIGTLTLLGLASPFLELSSGPSGIIGLIILFVGMRFAWRMTRGVTLTIEGPFQAAAAAKA